MILPRPSFKRRLCQSPVYPQALGTSLYNQIERLATERSALPDMWQIYFAICSKTIIDSSLNRHDLIQREVLTLS
jgi:hypothetical protein